MNINNLPRKFALCLAATGLLAGSGVLADVTEVAAGCNGCHGPDGVSAFDDMPTIAGMSSFAHFDALLLYQDGGRPCAESSYRHGDKDRPATSMCEVVKGMTEDDIEAIAEHYAEIAFVAADQEFDADLAAAGAEVHEAQCKRCHSDGGSNPDDDAGILAGQRLGYMRQSFTDYASGERDQVEKMQVKMDKLSDEEVEALLHYYASQQ